MIGRIDQQIRVNKIMIDDVDLKKVKNRMCRRYMYNYLEIITTVTTILCIISNTQENLEKKKELWEYIRAYDEELYKKLRTGVMGIVMNLPGKSGRKIAVGAYKISQKVVGFN